MKKRFLSMAAALALALALALPCAAEDAGFSFRSIDVKAEVHADNTITVTETYTLNGAPNGASFERRLHGDTHANGFYYKDVTTGGSMAAETDTDSWADWGGSVRFTVHGAGRTDATATLRYTIVHYDDLTDSGDSLLLDFFSYGLETSADSFTAAVTLPQDGVQKYGLSEGERGKLDPDGFTCTLDGTTLRVASTQAVRRYQQLTLYADFAEGYFTGEAQPKTDFLIRNLDSEVTVDSEMVYTVHTKCTVEANNRDSWLELPVLEFAKYNTPYTWTVESTSDNITDYGTKYGSKDMTLYLDTNEETGTFEAEYTYTLRPARLSTPFDFALRMPYWCDRLDALHLTFTAPGLHDAAISLENEILTLPKDARVTLTQQDGSAELTTRTPLYGYESMEFTAQRDSALYHRSSAGIVRGSLIVAALMLAVCAAGKFFFGTPRPFAAAPQAAVPGGINCAEFGYLLDGQLTNAELVRLVPAWGAQGHLSAEPCGGEFIFHALDNGPLEVPQYETVLFHRMFALGHDGYVTTVQLRGPFAREVSSARLALFSQYKGAMALGKGGAPRVACWLLSLMPAAALGFAGVHAMTFSGAAAFAAGLVCMLAQGVVSLPLLVTFAPRAGAVRSGMPTHPVLRAVCLAAGAGLAVGLAALLAHLMELSFWAVLAVTLLCCAGSALSAAFLCDPPQLHALLAEVNAFARFLAAPDADAVRAAQAAEPAYYYKMLPYAMAAGCAAQWRAAFAGTALPLPAYLPGVPDADAAAGAQELLVQALRAVSLPGAK